jgi:NADP-dependent 3-hydroxy acid dehydrogenase YdfG
VVEVAAARPVADDDGQEIEVTASGDVREAVCRALVEKGHGVIRLDRAHHKLENIFLELVAAKEASGARN